MPVPYRSERALIPGAAGAVVVELEQVERMDTSGVAVLVEGLVESRRRNLHYLLCAPSESVLRIFRLAGLHDALECSCASPEEVRGRIEESRPPS